MVAGDAVPESVERQPFHETIIDALEEAIANSNPEAAGAAILALTGHLNRTKVPVECMLPLAEELDRVANETAFDPPIRAATQLLREEHTRIIT